jgi:Kef-type K+ transport system membrane component KefB
MSEFIFINVTAGTLEVVREHLAHLSPLTRFIVGLAAVFIMPQLSRRLKLPSVIGLLFAGIILGPYVLDIYGKQRPVADFMSELGKLLLMFFAGLEVDLKLFRQSERKVIQFGLITTTLPLLLGTLASLVFGYAVIPSHRDWIVAGVTHAAGSANRERAGRRAA